MKEKNYLKTNVRYFNKYLITDENVSEFYLTEITDYKEWNKMDEKKLKEIKGKKITEKIKKLMELHKLYSNVNFHVEVEKQKENEDEIPSVNVVKVGGWGMSFKPQQKQQSGGNSWNGGNDNTQPLQSGGGWQKI